MAFLKQILVTILVLLLAGAVYLKFDPEAARPLLSPDTSLPAPLRTALVWIAPEAAGPPPVGPTEAAGGRHGRGGPTLVVTDPVRVGRTSTQMRAIGTGEAQHSVTVYPDNTTGIVDAVAVNSGDRVKAGAVLVQLEQATEELAVSRAQIALDAAEAKLQRYERLAQARTASTVEVDDAIRARDNAKLDLRSAQIALGKRAIRAPLEGRVGIVGVEKGDLVTSQSAIATVDDRSKLKVIFYTPERFVDALKVGLPIEAVSTAQPGKVYQGQISAIDSRLDEASRTLKTEALIDNSADTLRPGMSFTISLSLEGRDYLSVDPIAVVWERTGPIVWQVEGGKAKKVPIRIVERNIDRVLVASKALAAGDPVIVEGLQSVRENGPVTVQNQPAPATPRTGADAPQGGAAPSSEKTASSGGPAPAASAGGAPGLVEARADEPRQSAETSSATSPTPAASTAR
ncbi:efflux RND transporter periplasmic adaptor subunit [Jiella sp. M17.18]|uniref:efflux RND transporter periplasmic adaptor subunit n=1 Tax=Jiella sp. M17.18 TaxID=3234247 RepID=UPI0034DE9B34